MDRNNIPPEAEDQHPESDEERLQEQAADDEKVTVVETPAEAERREEKFEPVQPVEKPRRRTGLRFLLFLFLVLLLFGGGFAVAYFQYYQPANQERNTLVSDLQARNSSLEETRLTLEQRETELESLRSTAEANQEAMEQTNFLLALNTLQNDILLARLSLANEDLLTARQALRLAEADLQDLRAVTDDGEVVASLEERLNAARSAMGEDTEQAEAELRLLSENILTISDRGR